MTEPQVATTVRLRTRKRGPSGRRVFLGVLLACGLPVLIALLWLYGPAYRAWLSYQPAEGDVIFQSLPRGRLVDAIEGVSGSPFSHCGIVGKQDGRWVVYEAFDGVEITPLRTFLFRGRDEGFAVYRFRPQHRSDLPAVLEAARKYLGRPYDSRYRMDDEQIYCSELIWKAYRDATGESLGRFDRLGDLNWQPYRKTIEHYEGGPVPKNRELLTPKALALADELGLVFVHAIEVPVDD